MLLWRNYVATQAWPNIAGTAADPLPVAPETRPAETKNRARMRFGRGWRRGAPRSSRRKARLGPRSVNESKRPSTALGCRNTLRGK